VPLPTQRGHDASASNGPIANARSRVGTTNLQPLPQRKWQVNPRICPA